jgi:hypothetical protein
VKCSGRNIFGLVPKYLPAETKENNEDLPAIRNDNETHLATTKQ